MTTTESAVSSRTPQTLNPNPPPTPPPTPPAPSKRPPPHLTPADFESHPDLDGILPRIAREHGWSLAYTRRAAAEYRRFCTLAVLHNAAVSPSPAVDTIWHTHLLYTTHYWQTWCPKVLGMTLHHVPANGTSTDAARLTSQYALTLDRYRATFHEPPPPDLWPPPGTPHPDHRTIDLRTHTALPRLGRKPLAALVLTAVILLALLSLAAGPATPAQLPQLPPADLSVLDYTGPQFLTFFFIAFAVLFAAAWFLRTLARRPTYITPGDSFSPEPYELAMLSGGPTLTLSAAIASLARRNALAYRGERILPLAQVKSPPTHPLESDLLAALSRAHPISGTSLTQLRTASAGTLADLRVGLVERGFLIDIARATQFRLLTLFISLSVPALGIAKIFIGLSRDKPVGFLVAGVLLTAVIALCVFLRPLLRTTAGDAVLNRLRSSASRASLLNEIRPPRYATPLPVKPASTPFSSAGIDPLALGIALYGTPFLSSTPWSPLEQTLAPTRPHNPTGTGSSSTSGCSTFSSCGGSSDSGSSSDSGGSGCGGCGGGGD